MRVWWTRLGMDALFDALCLFPPHRGLHSFFPLVWWTRSFHLLSTFSLFYARIFSGEEVHVMRM